MQPTSLPLGSDKKQWEFHLLICSSASASSISPANPDCYLPRMQNGFVKKRSKHMSRWMTSNVTQTYEQLFIMVRSTCVFPCPATATDPMKDLLPWLIVLGTLLPQRGHSKPTLLPDYVACLPNLYSNITFLIKLFKQPSILTAISLPTWWFLIALVGISLNIDHLSNICFLPHPTGNIC